MVETRFSRRSLAITTQTVCLGKTNSCNVVQEQQLVLLHENDFPIINGPTDGTL